MWTLLLSERALRTPRRGFLQLHGPISACGLFPVAARPSSAVALVHRAAPSSDAVMQGQAAVCGLRR